VTSLVEKILAVHSSLQSVRIDHAFGGALALAYCTEQPRATSDIDLNIFVPPSQAAQALSALPFAATAQTTALRLVERDGQARLWWDETPVDVFFSYHPFHDRASRRAHVVPFASGFIPVLDCTDLAVFKAFFARTRDWADIEAMAAIGSVDHDDAISTVADLLGADDAAVTRLRAALASAGPDDDESSRRLHRALGGPPGVSPATARCGRWMPVAGRACQRAEGHRGPCR
jgi:hypothetical protein